MVLAVHGPIIYDIYLLNWCFREHVKKIIIRNVSFMPELAASVHLFCICLFNMSSTSSESVLNDLNADLNDNTNNYEEENR